MNQESIERAKTVGRSLAEDDGRTRWSAYYNAILDVVPGLRGSSGYVFQFANPDISLAWVNDSDPQNYHKELQALANLKPANDSAWYNAGHEQVWQNYETFLYDILDEGGEKTDSGDEDPVLKYATLQFEAASENLDFPVKLDGDLKADYLNWKEGIGTNPLTFSVTSTTHSESSWRFSASGDIAGVIKIVDFTLNGHGDGLDKHLIDDNFAFSVTFQAIKQYGILRDKWFDGGTLQLYKHAKFISGTSPSTYFGAEGSLNMIPTSIVVAYQPSISVTISRSKYDEFRLILEGKAQGTIRPQVGSFDIGGSIKFDKVDFSEDGKTATFNYQGNHDFPVLLGVFSVNLFEA